ncbi:MAG: hypothetical protein O3A65_06355 [Proteobacteria bacterium]|nr:hypothetical protein [Pseudomonadota bacterium]
MRGLGDVALTLDAANCIELFEELHVPIFFDRLILVCFLVFLFGPLEQVHAGDAAIEIQEGNIHNWIRYYEKELGIEIEDPVPQVFEAERIEVELEPQEASTDSTQN